MGYRTRGKHQKGKTGSREKGRSIVEGKGNVGKWRDGPQNGEGEGAEVGKDWNEGHII